MKIKIWAFMICSSFFMLSSSFGKANISLRNLEKKLGSYLGQSVEFTDELVYIWRNQPFQKKDKAGFIKFETKHVRCIIRESFEKKLSLIKSRLKAMGPKLLTFHGTVVKKKNAGYFVEIYEVEHPKYPKKKRKK